MAKSAFNPNSPHHAGTTRNLQSAELLALLGLPHGRMLPRDGTDVRTLDYPGEGSCEVWVEALPHEHVRGMPSRPHRIMGKCGNCERVMSAGRLFSHTCRKPRKRDRTRVAHPTRANLCNYGSASTVTSTSTAITIGNDFPSGILSTATGAINRVPVEG